jgi:hypothetical protein
MLTPVFEWLEGTGIATAVGQSLVLTGLVSAMHLLGLTLVAGGASVAWLRLLGLLLRDRPIREVTEAVQNGMLAGLGLSLATGLLLFAPRASSAAGSSTFQLKMLLLFAAVVFHFTIFPSATRHARSASWPLRLVGTLGPALWISVAVAGSAFILFE